VIAQGWVYFFLGISILPLMVAAFFARQATRAEASWRKRCGNSIDSTMQSAAARCSPAFQKPKWSKRAKGTAGTTIRARNELSV